MKTFRTAPLLQTALGLALISPSLAQEISLGSSAVAGTGGVDGWSSNMIIREEAIHINSTLVDQAASGVTFEFAVGNLRSRVTPFIVQINDVNMNGDFTDDNDFEVLHIGTTRVADIDYVSTGVISFPYSDGDGSFMIPAGTAIGAGYMDSDPDGLGGEAGSVIPFEGGNTPGEMWYAGNAGETHPNPIEIGTILSGPPAANVDNRNYQFSIDVNLGDISDADADGLPTEFEEMFDFLSDDNPDDAGEDEDSDFSTNLHEFNRGTDLENPDSDEDGFLDGYETKTRTWVSPTDTGTNPLDPDSDGDRWLDGVENNDGVFVDFDQTGTNPNLADTDSDGWPDPEEVDIGTNPSDGNDFPDYTRLGTDEVTGAGSVDGWASNLIIDEGRSYLNETGGDLVIRPARFRCNIGNVRSRLTPFIVRLNDLNMDGNFFDDNDFTVMAIGTTRVAGEDYTLTGLGSFIFDEASSEFTLSNGERIAAAFIDANPDGSEGDEGSVITYTGGVTPGEMWYNGESAAPHPSPPTPLSIGSSLSGAPAADVENRNYAFQIHFETGPGIALRITEIVYEDGAVTVTWTSKSNGVYAVDYSPDMTFWAEQTDDTESEGEFTTYTFPAGGVPDPASFTKMFIRVRDLTP